MDGEIMSRRNAREQALVLLYQCDLRKKSPAEIWEAFQTGYDPKEEGALLLDEKDLLFAKTELEGAWAHREEIDETISRSSHSWEVGRLSATLRAALRLAVYELNFREDIPKEVTANEAVELAKAYDGPRGASLVNGILSGVLRGTKE